MLKTGLEWFKLLTVCLIAILAWQVSLGADESVAVPKAELHLLNTMSSADTADPVIEQGYPGSNELFDGDVGSDDCAHYAFRMLPPQGTGFVISPTATRGSRADPRRAERCTADAR